MENSEDKRLLLIYHLEDNDGVFSAGIFSNWVERHNPDFAKDLGAIEYLPATYAILSRMYKEKCIDDWKKKYDYIVMTDISFNEMNAMKKIVKNWGQNFIWIDHHKPIIDKVETWAHIEGIEINGLRHTHQSALMNTFQYCYDPFSIYVDDYPEVLVMLSEYDSWNPVAHSPEAVNLVNRGMNEMCHVNLSEAKTFLQGVIQDPNGDLPFTVNKSYINNVIEYLSGIGKTIEDHNVRIWGQLMIQSAELGWTVDSRPAAMLVYNGATTSKMFEYFKDKGIKNGIVFKRNNKGKWLISLYNVDSSDHTFHCGKFLQKNFGKGGGHEGAGGATISKSRFLQCLKYKKL